jgi:hypothetical protein
MSGTGIDDEILSRQIGDWLLIFLRFVVTRDEADREAFLARAREMDRGGHLCTPPFAFFTRTSTELCDAILTKDDPQSRANLLRHLKRISDGTLRRTITAAIGPEPDSARAEPHNRSYLWKGLAPRDRVPAR